MAELVRVLPTPKGDFSAWHGSWRNGLRFSGKNHR